MADILLHWWFEPLPLINFAPLKAKNNDVAPPRCFPTPKIKLFLDRFSSFSYKFYFIFTHFSFSVVICRRRRVCVSEWIYCCCCCGKSRAKNTTVINKRKSSTENMGKFIFFYFTFCQKNNPKIFAIIFVFFHIFRLFFLTHQESWVTHTYYWQKDAICCLTLKDFLKDDLV